MKFKRSNLELQINKSPKNVVWCKNCVLSNQRPRVIFNKDNICSACINLEYKKNVNWSQRKKDLEKLLSRHRKKMVSGM